MAISASSYRLPESSDTITVSHQDFAIGGKLVATQIVLSHMDSMSFRSNNEFKIEIKKRIVSQLVEHLIDAGLIEVTYEKDAAFNGFAVRARAYIAPDEQVKLLRTMATK